MDWNAHTMETGEKHKELEEKNLSLVGGLAPTFRQKVVSHDGGAKKSIYLSPRSLTSHLSSCSCCKPV